MNTNINIFVLTWPLSSLSSTCVDPCSATCCVPLLANSPYFQKLQKERNYKGHSKNLMVIDTDLYSTVWEAPIMSLNLVNQLFVGKSLGWVCRDHNPSNVNWNIGNFLLSGKEGWLFSENLMATGMNVLRQSSKVLKSRPIALTLIKTAHCQGKWKGRLNTGHIAGWWSHRTKKGASCNR